MVELKHLEEDVGLDFAAFGLVDILEESLEVGFGGVGFLFDLDLGLGGGRKGGRFT